MRIIGKKYQIIHVNICHRSYGFIGFHLAKKLLDEGYEVKGFDSLNNYYDINLKEARLNYLKQHKKFFFHQR